MPTDLPDPADVEGFFLLLRELGVLDQISEYRDEEVYAQSNRVLTWLAKHDARGLAADAEEDDNAE